MKCPEGINLGRLFPNKFWEKIGLTTDTNGDCWNNGFIDGFNHLVYSVAVRYVVLYALIHSRFSGYAWIVMTLFPLGVFIFWFTKELIQARDMRHKQVWEYWEFWRWYSGKHQDYILPTLAILILNKITL